MYMAHRFRFAIYYSSPENFYWRGQNRSTTDVGQFPRSSLEKMAASSDISQPIRHSFIHAGHGDPTGQSWGDPSHIDE